ncbi:arginine--tRNA ligase [Flavobacterium subsaxonicum]
MLAWEKFGNGETPDSTGLKGDKLVGKYYVAFENELRKQTTPIREDLFANNFSNYPELESKVSTLNQERKNFADKIKNAVAGLEIPSNANGKITEAYKAGKEGVNTFKSIVKAVKDDRSEEVSEKEISQFEKNVKSIITLENKESEKVSEILEIARAQTPIMKEAQAMLLKWEAGDEAVRSLWATMNGWVYKGFEETYTNIGVDFDKNYYESNTYLLGKDVVEQGLASGVFFKKEDGSVWIDLTEDGLDEKLVLRKDGTSVYMTQDIGTAIQRVKDFPDVGGMVYTVGNEQDYHFKVLFLILKKLGFDWAANLYHLSYGMVDLPSGKMKSREGTVVDADDLMADMTETAQKIAEELGKLEGYSVEEKTKLYNIIGLGALKYYILKVDPKKRILFNPEESVDFAGNTGPFIQYTYARIQSLLRRADFDISVTLAPEDIQLHEKEKEVIKLVSEYPAVIQDAAASHSPALIANYVYELVRAYNSFYQTVPVLGTEVLNEKIFRIQLSKKVGETIKSAFGLLGIGVPDRM